MKKPEYEFCIPETNSKMLICKVCGSYVAVGFSGCHDEGHKEQAIPSSEKEWGGVD